MGTPELEAYLEEHDYAVRWAVANRDLVAYRIASCLGLSQDSNENQGTICGDDEETTPIPIMPEKLIDVTHNSVTKHTLPVGDSGHVWIHRKGAAPADMGVAPCPGSRGDFSWLLEPVGDGFDNGTSYPFSSWKLLIQHTSTQRFPLLTAPGGCTPVGLQHYTKMFQGVRPTLEVRLCAQTQRS